ncbi:nucleotidyltransferase domain-containing protein [Streptomyces sp. ISL-100]|uniref:nucleotidyltransferase domain-containing protein n=1 Tax=Streptomyces sp. ISL-100 TaxID=2819173 RepID=UPI001BEC9509|nr:nucleotidyltransferase domain-containing protein [Streptomyces sp. ISL-100]MBT2395732.1 nucleotidyltransferase domain-containing protein [Streptomyces sp. ISL-100]
MSIDFSSCLDELGARGLLPEHYEAAFVVGSQARGWGNALSDVDICVVTREPWTSDDHGLIHVLLTPDTVTTEGFHSGELAWELKYWLDGQVDQMIEKVAWSAFNGSTLVGQRLTREEEKFLDRMLTCVPLAGADWVLRRQGEIKQSAFRAFVTTECLNLADDYVIDAVGQLEAGDVDSAVLCARTAFGHAVDAVLASHGDLGRLNKWRARRLSSVRPEEISYEEYWNVETMRTFDPAAPEAWVRETAWLCKRLAMEVQV